MQDREAKKQAFLELIKKDPDAVVELFFDLMERVEVLEQQLAKTAAIVPNRPVVMATISPSQKACVRKVAVKVEVSQDIPARLWSLAKNPIG
jgi:hypothetical protein